MDKHIFLPPLMFGGAAKWLALSNGHIRWIIQGGWQTGRSQDGVSGWQRTRVKSGVDVSDALEGVAAACVRVRNACCLFGGNMRQIYRVRKGIMCSGDFGGRHEQRNAHTAEGLTCRPLAYTLLSPSNEREVSSARTKAPRHQCTKASRLSVEKKLFSSVRNPIHPKSWQRPRPVIDRQIYNAALPGPWIETWGRTRENQRREAEVKAAQRLIWSQPARSWSGREVCRLRWCPCWMLNLVTGVHVFTLTASQRWGNQRLQYWTFCLAAGNFISLFALILCTHHDELCTLKWQLHAEGCHRLLWAHL